MVSSATNIMNYMVSVLSDSLKSIFTSIQYLDDIESYLLSICYNLNSIFTSIEYTYDLVNCLLSICHNITYIERFFFFIFFCICFSCRRFIMPILFFYICIINTDILLSIIEENNFIFILLAVGFFTMYILAKKKKSIPFLVIIIHHLNMIFHNPSRMLLFYLFQLVISSLLRFPVYTVFINGGLDNYSSFMLAFISTWLIQCYIMHIITQIYNKNILKQNIKCNYSMYSVYKNIT